MKKILMVMAAMMVIVMLAGTAMALPFNVRPVTDPPATLFPPHGEQTLGGVGGIFDTIGADTYAVDPVNTQSNAAIFTSMGSGGAVATFIIEIAGNAGSNTVGIYEYLTPANKGAIFTGPDVAGTQRFISFFGDGHIEIFGSGGYFVSVPNFGNVFGFYIAGPGGVFYSEDSLNPNGNAQALVYQGNGSDTITIPPFSGGLFGKDEFIIAFEDIAWRSADKDFNDAVFLVESITPVPEPATMLLLGSGLIGLAGFARRKFKK